MKTCATCGARVGHSNKSGRCRGCYARSPEGRAARSKNMIALAPKLWADPAYRSRQVEKGKALAHKTVAIGSEIAAANRRSWCPASMWATYQNLRKNHGVRMDEAKRMVLEMHQAEGRREVRRIVAEHEAQETRRIAQAY